MFNNKKSNPSISIVASIIILLIVLIIWIFIYRSNNDIISKKTSEFGDLFEKQKR